VVSAGEPLSTTFIVKLYVPATVGIPVTEPVAGLRLNPGGKEPELTEYK